MLNIQELWLKGKNALEDAISEWGMIAIIILLGFASFGLGRLSVNEEGKPAISIRQATAEEDLAIVTGPGLLVASRSGRAYHYPWCPGAQSIAPSNMIWFTSEAEARTAGYSPAKNCKGLK